MDPLMELKQKRTKLMERAEGIYEVADEEERSLTEEEQKRFDDLMSEVDGLDSDIERRQALDDRRGPSGNGASPQGAAPKPEPDDDDPNIGMSEREVQQYSIRKAILAKADGNWAQAGLELEAHRAMVDKFGEPEQNAFYVPYDWMRAERRDLVKGTATQGQELVGTDHLGESFIDLLRNKMLVRQAGARMLTGLVGDVSIPKLTGGGTAFWVGEGVDVTESEQSTDQLPLDPHTVGAVTDISRKLLLQATPDAEGLVRDDLASIVAIEIDRVAIEGSGSGAEPEGILNKTGVGAVEIATDGGALAWSHVVQLEREVAVDNADIGALAYMTNPKVRSEMKETEKASGTARFIWNDESTNPVNGYLAHVTNQVPSDLTKGTGTNLSALIFGNWADLFFAQWGGLQILVDPYTGGLSGTLRIVVMQDVDIGIRHAESFAVVDDIVTS